MCWGEEGENFQYFNFPSRWQKAFRHDDSSQMCQHMLWNCLYRKALLIANLLGVITNKTHQLTFAYYVTVYVAIFFFPLVHQGHNLVWMTGKPGKSLSTQGSPFFLLFLSSYTYLFSFSLYFSIQFIAIQMFEAYPKPMSVAVFFA